MISICIPIYNCNITGLLTDLSVQCESFGSSYEIRLIDDGSEVKYQELNRNAVSRLDNPNIEYEELSENVGRSAIRNLLARKALFPYLLFIDNDAKVSSPHFVARYLTMCSPGIICYGGCVYECNSDLKSNLRWLYGVEREALSADRRQRLPNNYFSTFNFLIDKQILLSYPFNETIREYGYEDLLFKMELIKQGYKITHIENPLIHDGLISNEDFVSRTEIALNNLHKIQSDGNYLSAELIDYVNVLKVEDKMNRWKLRSFTAWNYRILRSLGLKNLLSNKPSLLVFDLYKLGYLCNLKNKNEQC